MVDAKERVKRGLSRNTMKSGSASRVGFGTRSLMPRRGIEHIFQDAPRQMNGEFSGGQIAETRP